MDQTGIPSASPPQEKGQWRPMKKQDNVIRGPDGQPKHQQVAQ